jgi:hypothetical protein
MSTEQQEIISTPILLQIPRKAYEAVAKTIKDNGDGAKFQALAQWFLNEFAAGGMMLKASNVAYIESIAPGKANSDTDIVSLIEAYAKRENGQYTFKSQVDPALIEPAKSAAFAQGCTLEDFISDALNTMLTNGWLYSFQPSGELRFTAPQMKQLEGLVGKSGLTGQDLCDFLFTRPNEMKVAPAEEAESSVATPAPKQEQAKKKV